MPLIEWNTEFELGHEKIDEQHKRLVGLINDLNAAMAARLGQEKLEGILTKLADYTSFHFRTEEELFDQIHYPDAAGHRRAHKEFVDQINDFQMAFDAGQLMLSVKVVNFLKEWLVAHIQGIDRHFAECLKREAA
jgi:hemerythrin-like metal-binding protein